MMQDCIKSVEADYGWSMRSSELKGTPGNAYSCAAFPFWEKMCKDNHNYSLDQNILKGRFPNSWKNPSAIEPWHKHGCTGALWRWARGEANCHSSSRVEMAAQVCSGGDTVSSLYHSQEDKCCRWKNVSKRRLAWDVFRKPLSKWRHLAKKFDSITATGVFWMHWWRWCLKNDATRGGN